MTHICRYLSISLWPTADWQLLAGGDQICDQFASLMDTPIINSSAVCSI